MHLAVHLAAKSLIRLQSALGPTYRITAVTTWAEMVQTISREQVDLILVDPAAQGVIDLAGCRTMVQACHHIPILLYTSPHLGAMKAVAELVPFGVYALVLQGLDDEPEQFRTIIERAAQSRIGHYIVELVTGKNPPLPSNIAKIVKRVFEAPTEVVSVNEMADAAHVSRDYLYQTLTASGFSSPHRILIAARVLRAYVSLRKRGTMVRDVAFRLGYSHPRVLTRHTLAVLGVKPHQLGQLEPERLVLEQIVQWIVHTARGARIHEA